jgi:hypothetical protein
LPPVSSSPLRQHAVAARRWRRLPRPCPPPSRCRRTARRRHCAGSAAAVDAALLPSCQAGRHRHAARSRHRRCHRTATPVAALPLPSPCCRRRCRPATPLPAAACCRHRGRCWPLPHCLRRSAGAATLLPPPTHRQAERKLPPPPHFRLVARHAAAKLPPPPPRTPRENRMTPMNPQKVGKTSSLAAAKRGRGKRPKRRWGKIPRPKVSHVDTKVFHVDTKINLSAHR